MKRITFALLVLMEISSVNANEFWGNKNFNPQNFSSEINISSKTFEESVFDCTVYDASKTPILTANEFSFRPGNAKSADSACLVLIRNAAQLITGENLKFENGDPLSERSWPDRNAPQYGRVFDGKYPVEYIMYQLSGNNLLGWYRANPKSLRKGVFPDASYFSFGLFAPPLKGMPLQGAATYKGLISEGSRSVDPYVGLKEIPIATINFAKQELSIDVGYKDAIGRSERLVSDGVIKINKTTGFFVGPVTNYTQHGVYKGNVSGYVGGEGAESFYASLKLHTFDGEGIDFILGKKQPSK